MRIAAICALTCLLSLSCDKKDESSLAERAQTANSTPIPPAKAEQKADPKAGAEQLVQGEAPTGPKVLLALKLPDDMTYVINTVGNTEFPIIANQIAFAREERVELGKCSGEGSTRSCDAVHRITAYTSEGETGQFFINDHDRIKDLKSTHRLRGNGMRDGETELKGSKEVVKAAGDEGLHLAHNFLCLRFPDEPVAKGAKWKDSCQRRTRGVLSTRDVLWEVAELREDPEGGMQAELRYVGKYSEAKRDGTSLEGSVQGILYFHADRGEPHILREQIQVTIDPEKGLRTKTTLNHTFGHVIPPKKKGGKEQLLLTNGEPFPEGINTRPPPPPTGEPASEPTPAPQGKK